MSAHVAAVSRSCFFQLRQLRIIRDSLSLDAAKTLVNAFVGSRLDYCNSLLAGATGILLTKLQSIQNAAARLITRTRKFDSITPVLRDLHWLPIRRRIEFKIATLVYKCLNGLARRISPTTAYSSQRCLADDTCGLLTLASCVSCRLIRTMGREHLLCAGQPFGNVYRTIFGQLITAFNVQAKA